ncbi:type II secretion system protein [Prosthecobacter sp. SYSU 5D2]|uniref:type II secretion system protein n=1 Tax=Prosthecobacter sp. SYSU 5D2 TaxID=3134134 RepID=UPI0031FE8F14
MKLVPPHRSASGFTLLELIVVMSIMLLVIGLGFGSFSMLDDNDPFEKPAQDLTQMSRFAINAAVLQHRTLTIAFDKEGFGILGSTNREGDYSRVPKGMKIFILRLGARDWEKAEGHNWQFGEQGICEPIKVRFESQAGVRDLAFHPLTGMTVD